VWRGAPASFRRGAVRARYAAAASLHRRGQRGPARDERRARDHRAHPAGLRRAAGRPRLVAGALPGAVDRERHGPGHRHVAALPGRRRRAGLLVAGRAGRDADARPRSPGLGAGRPLSRRAGGGGLHPPRRRPPGRAGRAGAGRAPPPAAGRLLRAAAGDRHPPGADRLAGHLGLAPPARQRQRLHLAPPLRPGGGPRRALPLRLRQRALPGGVGGGGGRGAGGPPPSPLTSSCTGRRGGGDGAPPST
jgi:hypothetical protein